jgi:uncharacterized repeat protein (TIGR01451 family)
VGTEGAGLALSAGVGKNRWNLSSLVSMGSNIANLMRSSLVACASLSLPASLGAAPNPPVFSQAFTPSIIHIGEVSTLSFSLSNTNSTALTGVAFTSTLPSGLALAFPGTAPTPCNGTTVSTNLNSGASISFSGGSLPANSSCVISVLVTGAGLGPQVNMTTHISANESGSGALAQAVLTVLSPVGSLQVRYSANLNISDSTITLTNTGATTTQSSLFDTTPSFSSSLCVNLYTFDPAEELISCCSCSVTPNGLQSLSVLKLIGKSSFGLPTPTSVVIKIVATRPTVCTATNVSEVELASGLAAWGTTIYHSTTPRGPSYFATEAAFTQANLTSPELAHITSTCSFIQANGSGFGICNGCPLGGLGASPSIR